MSRSGFTFLRTLRSAASAVLLATVANVVLIATGWAPTTPTPLQTMALQAVALISYMALGPIIPQDPAYHQFADDRKLSLCCSMGVPNAADVLSNGPFLIFGREGLEALKSASMHSSVEYQAWQLLFIAAVLVAFGSAYYHWRPTSKRLLWDRLPMSIGFASVIFIVMAERCPTWISATSLYSIVLISMATTIFWSWTDDLRPYLIVQYYGIVFVLQLLMLFESRYTMPSYWFWILGCYVLAKVFEMLDRKIFRVTKSIISGHTLKHLVASLVFLLATNYIQNRQIKSITE